MLVFTVVAFVKQQKQHIFIIIAAFLFCVLFCDMFKDGFS